MVVLPDDPTAWMPYDVFTVFQQVDVGSEYPAIENFKQRLKKLVYTNGLATTHYNSLGLAKQNAFNAKMEQFIREAWQDTPAYHEEVTRFNKQGVQKSECIARATQAMFTLKSTFPSFDLKQIVQLVEHKVGVGDAIEYERPVIYDHIPEQPMIESQGYANDSADF
jgi:CRISPR/Cas system CMR subunit Cmr6 (Cas7 group RAMP superfamily)